MQCERRTDFTDMREQPVTRTWGRAAQERGHQPPVWGYGLGGTAKPGAHSVVFGTCCDFGESRLNFFGVVVLLCLERKASTDQNLVQAAF